MLKQSFGSERRVSCALNVCSCFMAGKFPHSWTNLPTHLRAVPAESNTLLIILYLSADFCMPLLCKPSLHVCNVFSECDLFASLCALNSLVRNTWGLINQGWWAGGALGWRSATEGLGRPFFPQGNVARGKNSTYEHVVYILQQVNHFRLNVIFY